MNRLIAAVTCVATAATAAIAMAATITPALAAQRPAIGAKTATHAARTLAAEIAAEFGRGTSVTVERCSRAITDPPPLRIAAPDAAPAVRGHGPVAGIVRLLGQAHAGQTVYTCTVIVELKAPVTARKATRAVHPGWKGCGIGTAGSQAGSGKDVGCSRVVTLGIGFGGADAVAARPIG